MVIVLLANGFEELEAITPVDVMRRNNIDVRTVSITNEKLITGTHGIQIAADLIASDVPLDGIDMLILPGGMPGVKNLDASPITKIFIDATLKNKGRLAAICAAPSIFGKHGMLTNIKATCFPGFESEMHNAILSSKDVVTDGIFTTAKDYKAAGAFAEELVRICDKLGLKPHDDNEEALPESSAPLEFDLESLFDSLDKDDEKEEKLLEEPEATVDTDDEEIASEVKTIIETLASFGVNAAITAVDKGPRIIRYEITPHRGVKVNSITNLSYDIALCLGKEGIRMVAPIPGKSAIGLEVPRAKPELVRLKELLECEEYTSSKSKTLVPIGKDVSGNPVFGKISSFPHALVCGATGMGKSVVINSFLTSLISKNTPEDIKLILIDPKKVEFRTYYDIPHLITPVITDSGESAGALAWAVEEMERRYELFIKHSARSIETFNEMASKDPTLGKPLPKIIIVIDELADLMMQVRDPVEALIMRLAQKSRAAGIHLIIATQRPSVNVLTGTLRANIPTRMSCKVTSQVDSRTIFDIKGAESLLNKGDMLYWPVTANAPIRVQAPFVSDSEVEEIANELKKSGAMYDDEVTSYVKNYASALREKARARNLFDEDENDNDSYYNDSRFLDAVELAIRAGKASTSLLQRKLSIGYGKAAAYIDTMEEIGVISGPMGQKPRDVLMTLAEWEEKLSRVKD